MNSEPTPVAVRIMIIRHAEKPTPSAIGSDGKETPRVAGVLESGMEDPHSLTVQGWQRAGALVNFFLNPSDQRLTCPKYLFAAGGRVATASTQAAADSSEDAGHRPVRTLMPLWRKLKLENANILFDHQFAVGSEDDLCAAVIKCDGPVLVSWEHKKIISVANLLLKNRTGAPQEWPSHRFDMAWVFDLVGGKYQFVQVPQNLLAGDSPEPIPDRRSLA